MDLHYLSFMGRNLKNNKKLTLVQITNNVDMNIKIVVNNVGIFSDSGAINNILSE